MKRNYFYHSTNSEFKDGDIVKWKGDLSSTFGDYEIIFIYLPIKKSQKFLTVV